MHKRNEVSLWLGLRVIWRVATAGTILAAVAWQFRYVRLNNADAGNFLSYFTIQSNIIGAATLIWAALARKRSTALDICRSAATLYLGITGVVFALLLSKEPLGLTLPWVNFVLHQLSPVVVVLDWLSEPPLKRLHLRQVLIWLAYPIAWLGYTLIRGPLASWYPYPFIDPTRPGGYARVGGYIVIIALFTLGASYILLLVGRPRKHL